MKTNLYNSCGIPRGVAIVGPTASGKTSFSLFLAERMGGEIIGCDSMQIYCGMDIGTAKATAEERARVPHHLIDFVDPCEPYSAADYGAAARATAAEILARGHLPILCGGTGLYLEAARLDRHSDLPPAPPHLRGELEREAAERGAEAMYAALAEVDPASAAATHPNNLRRVLRALEIYRATGRLKSEWDLESRSRPPLLELLVLGLFPKDREVLRHRIDLRVDAMVASGLFDEVRGLYERGKLQPGTTAAQAIGYKEVLAALSGELPEDVAIENIKYATHRYARRQLTWFRAVPDLIPLACDEGGVLPEERERACSLVLDFLGRP